MLWDAIKDWKGAVSVNGEKFESVNHARSVLQELNENCASVILYALNEHATEREKTRFESVPTATYRVTVRQYMTKPASVDFDFMEKWNHNVPMPLRTMVGTIEKETQGMVYMKLHGDITARVTEYCMKCGRPITNPVSKFFGMGPECGGHGYVNPFSSEEELKEAVEKYRRDYLQRIVWEGWIIKSAILEQEEVDYELR